MADLDRLSIVLTASAKNATEAIDSIITSLSELNGALNNFRADSPYMKGLNNLATGLKSVRISLNGLDSNNIREVAKALDKMASSSSKLAQLTGFAPKIDNKTVSNMTEVVAASDKAYQMAEKMGEKLNFDSASDGVARLAEGIEQLQAAIGDDDAVREAMKNIDALLEKYGRWKSELQDFYKAQRDIINSNTAQLGYGAQEALGGDWESARRNRAKAGLSNTAKVGTNISSIADENTILGIQREASEIEQLSEYIDVAAKAAEGARQEFVGFHEAGVTLTGGMEALQAETNEIAQSMGIAAEKIREAHNAIDEDDFMSQDTTGANLFDDPVESIAQLRESVQEAVPAIEALNNAEQHLAENAEPMAQVGNIFQGITTALESLQNITLSDSLSNITYLKDAISKLGSDSATKASANIQNLGSALQNFQFNMPRNWSDLVALSNVFNRFGLKSQSKANYNILAIRNALERFQGLTIDPAITTSIQQLGDGLYRFGLAKMDKAVKNIPQLAGGMTQLITSLANMPQVSENTIRLVTALGNININGSALNSTFNGVNSGLKRYTTRTFNARKASMSLASAFGRMYANFFIFFRLANRFKKDIDLASDLTEVQNVVDVTFGNMADRMNDFAKSAIDTLGMSELTAKQIGSRFQAMGTAMDLDGVVKKYKSNVSEITSENEKLLNSTGVLGKIDVKDAELKELGKGGSVNLELRPVIDSKELRKVGWDAGEGAATVFSSTFSNEAGDIAVNFTPIIADEDGNYIGALSPEELDRYASEVIEGVHTDDLKLQIGAEFKGDDIDDIISKAETAADRIHEIHESYSTVVDDTNETITAIKNLATETEKAYGAISNVSDISLNLTKLAGDMASFFNTDYEDVAKDLEAVYTGLSKPLRKYGVDLSQASLSAWALSRGMEANFKTMTQAEKTLLRYQYVMAHTTAAHGDFIRTQNTWANQIRIATERLDQLRIVLGKIAIYTFKPLVQSFNRAMEQIIKGAEGLLNSLGKIFGWQIEWNDGGILNEEADDSEELADNMGDAADNAKKFKNFLLGIDELNVLPSNDDKDKGKGSGLGDLGNLGDAVGGFNIKPIEKGFDSIYDTLFKLGARINEIIKDLLDSIDWDTVYNKARAFGKGLAQFVNGLLNDAETFYKIGKTLANGINAIAHVIDAYHKEFDGWQWGVDIGNFVNGFTENLDWHVIRSAAVELAHDLAQSINAAFVTIKWDKVGSTIAEGLNTAIDYFFTLGKEINFSLLGTSIANAINGFFKTFDFVRAAETLNYWAKGLLDALISALERTDWKKVGKSIGEFIGRIDFIEIAGKISHALWDAINGAISAYTGLFEGAPITTALATALALPFTNKVYFSQYIRRPMLKWSKKVGDELAVDLSKVLKGDVFKTFADAFKSTEIGLDPFGNLTSSGNLKGIANGFNAVSASLSKTTKAVGGLAVGFGELFVVKDAVYDIVHGTDNLALSIAELTGAVGVAGVAFSALLGVPMGLIATGAAAAVGAITGITNAMEDLEQENAIAAITRDMGDAYGTLNDFAEKYKTIASNITDGLDQLHNDYIKVEELKNSLNELAGGYGLVVSAIDGGNQLTSKAMQELIGDIGKVKDAWEDYVNAQYNYLIQSTINDYQFAKAQGVLTDEKEKEYLDRIQELTGRRDEEVEELTRLIGELEKAQNYYNTVMEQGVNSSTKEFAEKWLADATKGVLEFGAATGAVTDGALSEFEDGLDDLRNMKFDFSNIDATDYDALLTEAEGYLGQIQEKFANSSTSIEQTIADRMKADPTLTREQAEKDVKIYYDALNEATMDAMDSLQINIYDILAAGMEDGDRQSYVAAHNMNEEFIKPLMEQITDMYEQAANGEKPKLEGIITNLFKDTWSKGGYFDGGPVFKDVDKNLEKYRKQLENTSNTSKDMVKELKIEEAGMIGIADSAKTSSYAMGNVERAMGDVFQTAGLLKSGVIDVNKAFEETSKSGENIKNISTDFGALGTTLSGFSTAFMPVKEGLNSFTTDTQMNMQKTTAVFGESFTSIMKYGNQTISWLKGSFVPYFSGAYWNGVTSSIPNAFGNAFRQAINIMQNLWKQFSQWANQNMKMNVNMKGKEVTGIEVKIPQYDTGGFPEDGIFRANHGELVGQFANGKTAVANNEQIVEGIKQGVYEAMASAMSQGNGNVTVELVGDASDIFTAVVKENNRTIMRTGTSPIRN